jgi:hypothetical protein
MTQWLWLRTWLLVLSVQAGLGAAALLVPAGQPAAAERMAGQAAGPMWHDCAGCIGHHDMSNAGCPLSCASGCPALLPDDVSEPHAVSVAGSFAADSLRTGRTSHPEPGPPRPLALS